MSHIQNIGVYSRLFNSCFCVALVYSIKCSVYIAIYPGLYIKVYLYKFTVTDIQVNLSVCAFGMFGKRLIQ